MISLRPCTFLLLIVFIAHPTTAETVEYSLGLPGRFEVDVPDGWNWEFEGGSDPRQRVLLVTPPNDFPLLLLIEAAPTVDSDSLDKHVLEVAKQMRDGLAEVSVESEIPLREIAGPGCKGYFASATDRTVETPTLEEFKYADQGALRVGSIFVTFTLLTNVPDAPERELARGIIVSARPVAAPLPSETLQVVMLEPGSLPEGCSEVEGEHPVSIQAGTFYALAEEMSPFAKSPVGKTFRSYECGGRFGTIYYVEYPTAEDVDATIGFVKMQIWGENRGSRDHPEAILAVDNILVIVSFQKPGPFKKLLKAR